MKECPRCRRQFEKGNYCTYCGSLLEEKNDFDIFGDPLYDKPHNSEGSMYQDRVIYGEFNEAVIEEKKDNFIESRLSFFKSMPVFIALLSIGTMFLPFYGFGISLLGIILNAKKYSQEKKNLPYLIISIVTIVLNVVFLILLLVSGVLIELYQSQL